MFKQKTKAFLIHLLLSAVVISALFLIILLYWFPEPFLGATNFKEIALILIAIDLILGPLLTFVVFNPGKKGLRLDLSIIVSIQIMGLSYGLYMLFLTHPVYITYHENSFNIITAKQARPDKATNLVFQVSKLSSPTITFLNIPTEDIKNKLFNDMMNGDAEIEARADYYEPYTDHLDEILANSIEAAKIFSEENIDDASKDFLEKHSHIDNFAFIPLVNGSSYNGIIVLNKDTGKIVSTINTSPWRFAAKQ